MIDSGPFTGAHGKDNLDSLVKTRFEEVPAI